MQKMISVLVMSLVAGLAQAQESPIGNETPAADQAADQVETEQVAMADGKKEFEAPPGFKTKKRGKHTVYCVEDATIGTRFKTERCLDEEQVREYLLAREVQKRDIDRIRSTCASAAVCSNQ